MKTYQEERNTDILNHARKIVFVSFPPVQVKQANMDHLFDFWEEKLLSTNLDVYPWLGFDHDGLPDAKDFSVQNYPYVRGRSHQDILRLTAEGIDNLQDLALLQSWLFFGVLENTLQCHVPSAAFLEQNQTHGWILDTSPLRTILGDLKTDLVEKRRHEIAFMRHFAASLDEALRFSASFNRVLINHIRVAPDLKSTYESVVQSSSLLAESLYALHEFLLEDDFAAFLDLTWVMTSDADEKFCQRLVKRGWCPSVYPFAQSKGLSMLQYAVALEDEGFNRNTTHDKCTIHGCKVNDVDLATYEPTHTKDCNEYKCQMVTADNEQLTACLRAETFPIVDATRLILGGALPATQSLPVIPYQPGIPFVAISHVWAHGRGSVAEKGLPFCQIKNLVRIALAPNVDLGVYTPYLWIDSLCVPDDQSLRGTAIQLMSSVYQSASATIVLDEGMQNVSAASTDHFLLRLMLSDWNRRLWTLQEALLSKDVHILTPTGLVSLKRKFITSLQNPVRTAVSLRITTFFIPFISPTHRSTRFFALLLKDRSTSKPNDEALAIAPLFGVDVKPLISLSGDERQAAFWRNVKSVPRGLVFMGDTDRLSTPGMTWAPKTLMAANSFMDTTDTVDDARVTDQGLQAVYLVLKFKNKVPLPRGETSLAAHDSANDLYYLVKETAETGGDAAKEVLSDAIILQRDLRMQEGDYEAVISAVSVGGNANADLPVFKYLDRRAATVAQASEISQRLPEGMQLADIVDVECEPLEELEILVT